MIGNIAKNKRKKIQTKRTEATVGFTSTTTNIVTVRKTKNNDDNTSNKHRKNNCETKKTSVTQDEEGVPQ